MPTIEVERFPEYGITVSGEEMENGERRFRLMNGGFGYILTVMTANQAGGWQNAHYHLGVQETYIVQQGWIASAQETEACVVELDRHLPGSTFTTFPGRKHNIYMSPGTVIHTVKHGDVSREKDWFGSPALDEYTKKLTEEDILRQTTLA